MKSKVLCLVIALFLLLTACQGETEYLTENHDLGLQGAEVVQADIEMRSGDVTIQGGSDQEELLQAAFSYNADKEPPQLNYVVDGKQGDLAIKGTDAGRLGVSFKGQDNIWDLAFNDNVPLDLALTVSDTDLDLLLAGLTLTRLETVNNSGNVTADLSGDHPQLTAVDIKRANGGRVEMDLSGRFDALSTIDAELNGARLSLDLSGELLQDLAINLGGGSGNKVTLKLPRDAAIMVHVDSDTNEVTAEGFQAGAKTYGYETGEADSANVDVQIVFDRGQVTLELAD